MAIQRIQIEDFLAGSEHALLLDVRSPSEFAHGHMPGAISFPLFSDEERKIVGTAYKQQSREQAIKEGLQFFGPNMRNLVEQAETLFAKKKAAANNGNNTIYVYCWRGGMRSGAVAWLLDLYGFSIKLLSGGYKTYRRHVLEVFTRPFPFLVLGGYTGSGKTEVLHLLQQKGKPVVDLEGIACHKGSAFGKIGMPPQPTQEMFENNLCKELLKANHLFQSANDAEAGIWIEDESQRIGQLNLPGAFWETLRSSPVYFLDIPFENRLAHITEEYGISDKAVLAEAIQRITKRLGGLETKNALRHLEENNLSACFHILLSYYDKQYFKGLHNRANLSQLLQTIAAPAVADSNADLLMPSQVV